MCGCESEKRWEMRELRILVAVEPGGNVHRTGELKAVASSRSANLANRAQSRIGRCGCVRSFGMQQSVAVDAPVLVQFDGLFPMRVEFLQRIGDVGKFLFD
jgi:hypothetical protein